MDSVKVEVLQKEKASRVELLVRLVYWIPLVIVLFVLQIIGFIAFVVNIVTVLLLGKRILGLSRFIGISVSYRAKTEAYLMTATDERPKIIPEELQ